MKKEAWIEETMHSLAGQEMAECNAFLHTRVMQQLAGKNATRMPVKWMLAVVSCLLVLCFLNVSLYTSKSKQVAGTGVDIMIKDYGLTNDELYSTAK